MIWINSVKNSLLKNRNLSEEKKNPHRAPIFWYFRHESWSNKSPPARLKRKMYRAFIVSNWPHWHSLNSHDFTKMITNKIIFFYLSSEHEHFNTKKGIVKKSKFVLLFKSRITPKTPTTIMKNSDHSSRDFRPKYYDFLHDVRRKTRRKHWIWVSKA